VIALHGYIDPQIYQTLDYTTRYADSLARAGFLVIHPNLRGYAPSDDGDNLFRVGMAVDVLNLIALVGTQGGSSGSLRYARPDAIGVWGHSMGGGISLRVITINPSVRGAVLYGAMSGDDRRNYQRIFDYFSGGTRGQEELGYPPDAFQVISAINYLDRIQAQISIHHGERDPDVPPDWSRELCQRLGELEKQAECFFYPQEAHTFGGEGDELFMQRVEAFFRRVLIP
jgi:dipeptidyl aminopeptidase/acylaminoacyl peptidase